MLTVLKHFFFENKIYLTKAEEKAYSLHEREELHTLFKE